MVKGMAFIAYSVKDVPKAKVFYRDIIGLTPGDVFGDQWAEFEVDGVTFGIGNGASIGIEPGSQFRLCSRSTTCPQRERTSKIAASR
jgi:catechol 2,3-dioxygenase-like lactoylglutathione lyase family enzyme